MPKTLSAEERLAQGHEDLVRQYHQDIADDPFHQTEPLDQPQEAIDVVAPGDEPATADAGPEKDTNGLLDDLEGSDLPPLVPASRPAPEASLSVNALLDSLEESTDAGPDVAVRVPEGEGAPEDPGTPDKRTAPRARRRT